MVQVTIELGEDEVAALARTFDNGDPAEVATSFAGLAVREYLDWINGRARYRTLTEEHLARVERIYEAMLPKAEAPSFNRLYNSFNMPHGQAAYVARALGDKTLRHWRGQALRDLLADLERVRGQAMQRQEAGDGDKGLNVRTTRMASIELNRLCDAEFKIDRNFIGPTAKGGVGDQRLVELPADSVMVMIDRVGQEVANA
ncbi:hypothetical protein [Brevundimonas lutea]|uniref:hypothetical protein n=1 Tax=Brevundimonas lutea TaxID=2293980 RepID=UPI000F044A52|nr:hypothetical protein [Brevundimonas lutea]